MQPVIFHMHISEVVDLNPVVYLSYLKGRNSYD